MTVKLLLACALLVATARPAAGQNDSAGVADAIPVNEVDQAWEAVLADYRRGKRRTEVDMMRDAAGATGYAVGTFRRGGPPRVLRPSASLTAPFDSAWIERLVTEDLVDGACAEVSLSRCPGEYVTLFLTLEAPEREPRGRVSVLVREIGLDPSLCRVQGLMMGEFVRRFIVEQKDDGWRVRSAKSVSGATLRCTPGE